MITEAKELIVVKQLPVIEEHLKTIGEEAKKRIDMALSMPCTPETKKAVKEMRASLTKEFKTLEEARKNVENEIAEQLKPFRDSYKEYITSVYSDADCKLKAKITEVEDAEKLQKETNLREYFNELTTGTQCEFLEFEQIIPKVDLSKTEPFYKKQIDSRVELIKKDLEVIGNYEYSAELMVEYRKTLDLANSLVLVTNRHMEMESVTKEKESAEQVKIKEEETIKKVDDALSAPVPVLSEEKVYTMTFTVTGTKSKLKELKNYLLKEGLINE